MHRSLGCRGDWNTDVSAVDYSMSARDSMECNTVISGNMQKTKIKLSKTFLIEFFNLYHQHPCLWDKENPDYNIKASRDQAADVLTRKMKEVNQDAGRYETLRKIYMYRSNFKRELMKRELRECAGMSPVKSTLWYYDCLQFLVKTLSKPRKRNVSSKNSLQVQEVDKQNDLKNHELESPIGTELLTSLLSEKSQNGHNPAQPEQLDYQPQPEQQQLNQRCEADTAGLYYDEVKRQIEKSLLDQKRDELVATVMENIGNKLKSVPLHKLPLVEKLIGDLLYKIHDRDVGQFTQVNLSEDIPSFEQAFLSGQFTAPFNIDLELQHPTVTVAPLNIDLEVQHPTVTVAPFNIDLEPHHPEVTAVVTFGDYSKRCSVNEEYAQMPQQSITKIL